MRKVAHFDPHGCELPIAKEAVIRYKCCVLRQHSAPGPSSRKGWLGFLFGDLCAQFMSVTAELVVRQPAQDVIFDIAD